MENKKNPAIQSEAEQQAQERNVANQKNPKILSEAEQQEQERMTKETIDAQEQVELLIFPDGNPAPLKVTINGVDYRYPKGQKVQVPAAVAEVINHMTEQRQRIAEYTRLNENRSAGVL